MMAFDELLNLTELLVTDTAGLVYDEHDVRRTFTPCKHQSRTTLYVVNLIVVSSTKAQLFFVTMIVSTSP